MGAGGVWEDVRRVWMSGIDGMGWLWIEGMWRVVGGERVVTVCRGDWDGGLVGCGKM